MIDQIIKINNDESRPLLERAYYIGKILIKSPEYRMIKKHSKKDTSGYAFLRKIAKQLNLTHYRLYKYCQIARTFHDMDIEMFIDGDPFEAKYSNIFKNLTLGRDAIIEVFHMSSTPSEFIKNLKRFKAEENDKLAAIGSVTKIQTNKLVQLFKYHNDEYINSYHTESIFSEDLDLNIRPVLTGVELEIALDNQCWIKSNFNNRLIIYHHERLDQMYIYVKMYGHDEVDICIYCDTYNPMALINIRNRFNCLFVQTPIAIN